jgi:hypothetical protein
VREHTTVARAAESGTRDEHLDGASAGISNSKGFWRGEAQAQPRSGREIDDIKSRMVGSILSG